MRYLKMYFCFAGATIHETSESKIFVDHEKFHTKIHCCASDDMQFQLVQI